jgi:cellulose synthase operon protein C
MSTDTNAPILTVTDLASVQDLYDQGLYSAALDASRELGELTSWRGPAGRVLAGRLAGNLGAPRLARALHWQAGREHPDDPACQYYAALAYWSRFGSGHAWRRYRLIDPPPTATASQRADWLAFKALLVATFRDFSRADELMIAAIELDPDSPWLHVELSELLDREDMHEDSLRAAQEALKLRPFFRPGVQAAAHRLVQLRRDDEALQLLTSAAEQLQSGEILSQLAVLQTELKQYTAAWDALERAEKFWPLAQADSQHRQWLASQRSDVAYYRGEYQQALELAATIERPFYERLCERLQLAITTPLPADRPHRVQLEVPFVRQHHNTCAPATLSSLAQYWRIPIRHEEIVERICYDGTQSVDERRWAEENGFHAREFRITEACVEQLIRAGIPMTLNTVDPGSAHLQALVGFDLYRQTFLVQDPGERHVAETSADKFLAHYASSGPRGMLLLPPQEMHRLDGIELPEADLYDQLYEVDRQLARFQRAAAVAAIETMRQQAPDHRLTLQAEFTLARYDGNSSQQLRLVESLLVQFPGDANLLLYQCSLLTEFGHRAQRLDLLRSAAGDKTAHPILRTRLAAELLEDARDLEEAAWHIQHALRFNASNPRTLMLYATLLWDNQDKQEALDFYRLTASLSEKDESQARRYFAAARYLHQTQVALEWLEDRYRRFGMRSSLPGRTLAYVLEQLDQQTRAIAVLEETVQRHPEDGELLCDAALSFGRINHIQRADELLRQARGRCPEPLFLRTGGQLAVYARRLQEARELLLRVLELDPLDVAVRERVIGLDMDLEGLEVAETRLRSAVDSFPHSYSLRTLLIQWLRTHKLADVEAELQQFLEIHPRDAWSRREAAIAAYIAHDLPRAAEQIAVALELEPRNELSHLIQARIYKQRGQVEQARASFREAVRCNVDYEPAIQALVETCERPHERAAELDFIFGQLQQQTTYGDGVQSYRDAAAGRIDPARLLEQLEEALAQRPDLWQCWSAVVQQHLAMHHRDRAVELARGACERFPLLPRIWLDLALVHRALGDHDAQLAALEQARSINPHWTEVARELSQLHLDRQDYAAAEGVLRQVLAADPRDPMLLALLGDCLALAGKAADGLPLLAQACTLAPSYDWAWSRLSELSQAEDQGSSAARAAQAAIDARPHDALCYYRMAEMLSDLEAIPRALEYLERALALEPRFVDGHVLRAYYLGRMYRWDEALQACTPAVFGDQVPVLLLLRRAFLLYRQGLPEAAIAAVELALQSDPDHYLAWNQLADWAEETGDPIRFKLAAENMVRIDPHQPIPRGYLAEALLSEQQQQQQQPSASQAGTAKQPARLPEAATENARPSPRAQAKLHLQTALAYSPAYAFGTQRLLDLHLEDQELDAAQEVLDATGEHLPPGYLGSYQLRLHLKSGTGDAPPRAVEYLLSWLGGEAPPSAALRLALDQFPQPAAQLAQRRLLEQLAQQPGDAQLPQLGSALGLLLGRWGSPEACTTTLQSIAAGEAWHATAQALLGCLRQHQREVAVVEAVRKKFHKTLRDRTASWAAMAHALLDFDRNEDIVQWTKDWASRQDMTPAQLVVVVASRWETFRWKSARGPNQLALTLEPDFARPLHHVWAGLDALLTGEYATALSHAQQVSMHDMSRWYGTGYKILLAALAALPDPEAPPPTRREIAERIRGLTPKRFPIPETFASDRLTKWILRRVAAQVASAYNRPLQAQLHQWLGYFLA